MLKSLELFGFKSFADRTIFDFAEGITCVVGPNGSGKSNVVDAIKWLLGDQSPKSLRGKEMTDVIFNGAAGRKGSAFAEAMLTFDNSKRFLPLDANEVVVGRRLWRNGDSEYLINRATTRLKDVRDLFLGTGTATSAYSIIEQGRVDQILQSNATARRNVFDEAAGISRFKSRKTEALRKLERVAQNLLRLTDIVDEVEGQLNSTRSQAAKAAKFRETSDELRTLWMGLAADEHRHFTQQLTQIQTALDECASQIEALNEQQGGLESQLAALDQEIADVDDRMRQVERRVSANREGIVNHQATIRHQTNRQAELEGEIVRLRKQRADMLARTRQIENELRVITADAERVGQAYQRQKEQVDARTAQLAELSSQADAGKQLLERSRQQQLDLMRGLSQANNRVAGLQSQLASTMSAAQELAARREALEAEIEATEAECRHRQELVQQIKSQVEACEASLQATRTERDALAGQQDQFQTNLAELRERRSGWQARLAVLEDLERRQQGMGIGVKEILSRAKTSTYPPWNQVLGSVADLLEADLEDAALLEVALGSRAQLIVLQEFGELLNYLEHGASQITGRVGFVSLSDEKYFAAEAAPRLTTVSLKSSREPIADNDTIGTQTSFAEAEPPRQGGERAVGHVSNVPVVVEKTSTLETCSTLSSQPRPDASTSPVADFAKHPGVIKRADELVCSAPQAPRLARFLLADTWIVKGLEVAVALNRGSATGCRFVTLQGELLESDGTLYVGAVGSDNALVSRKSELRRLKNDLVRLERSIADEERKLTSLGSTLSVIDRKLGEIANEKEDLADAFATQQSELKSRQQVLERLNQDFRAAGADLTRLNDQVQQLRKDLVAAQMEIAQGEEDLRQLQETIEEQDRDLARFEHRRKALQQKQTDERLQLAKDEERLTSLQNDQARLASETQQREQQGLEAARRFEVTEAKRRQIVLQILTATSELADLFLIDERWEAELNSLAQEKDEIRRRRTKLASDESRIRKQRRELDHRQHAADMQARDIRHQLATCEERIREEYHVELAEVVASGVSAFADYLQQRNVSRSKASRKAEKQIADENGGEFEAEAFEPDEPDDAAEVVDVSDSDDFLDDANTDSEDLIDDEVADFADADDSIADDSNESTTVSDAGYEYETQFADVRDELNGRVDRLRRKLKTMGNVNTDSLNELDELAARHCRLSEQLQDLVEAKTTLEEIVRRINLESKRLFVETFDTIRGHFQELYRKLFGGGEGDIILEDPEDVLDCGIDIVARPPGKELRSITLLSGGEKTLTAVALLLAIFRSRPSPFCILDEVDAALDEANVERYGSVIKEFEDTTQFIMITHSKRSMAVADILYGVTMEQSGVSKRMSVRFEDVSDNGEISVNAAKSRNAPVSDAA